MNESTWYTMMGLSKIFLRNFLIGCFFFLILTCVTLATLLNSSNQERLLDERNYRAEVVRIKEECDRIKEIKNTEYNSLLREALTAQQKIDREITELRKKVYRQ